MRRRDILGSIAAGSGVLLAGCSGSSGDEEEQTTTQDTQQTTMEATTEENSYWPPPRGIVDIVSPASPGDTRDTLPRLWGNRLDEHYPGDVSTTVTPTPGAGGLIASNKVWNAPPDGGSLLTQGMVPMGILQLTNSATQYKMAEFVQLMAFQTKARAVQVSHHSTAVEDHWDWDWETFTTKVKEENLKFGATAITQFLLRNFFERYDPNLEPGDIEIVPFDSGGNARATIQRGELDGYFGGFGPNYPRSEYYKTQFVIADDRYPAYYEQAQKIDSDAVFITETSFPTDGAKKTVDATIDALGLHAPPGLSQELIEIHEEAMRKSAEDPQLRSAIENSLGAVELNFGTNFIGQDVRDFADRKSKTLQENRDLIPEVFD